MGSSEKYCLKWNDYRSNISLAFQDLRSSSDFCDVTLATDEAEFQAHRVILSACSPHLRDLLKRHSSSNSQNLLIYLRGVRHSDLTSILEFMYNGEVNVAQEDLTSFLAVAEDLKVKGLTQELGGSQSGTQQQSQSSNDKSVKPKVTLTPSTKSISSKNGGSTSNSSGQPPVKRAKQELVRIKQEDVAKKASMNDEDAGAASNDAGGEAEGDAAYNEELYYEDYEDEKYGTEPALMVDPSVLAGTSYGESRPAGSQEEQDYLSAEIGEYLTSMSARRDDGQYQCLVCARNSRDLYNQRQHIMTHMMKDTEFLNRLDRFVMEHSVQQKSNSYACLLCRMIISRGFYMVRQHFFSKHLKEEKYLETY